VTNEDQLKPQDTIDLDSAVDQLRQKFGVPKVLVDRMVNQESGGNTKAISPVGARGRFQVMPGTIQQISRETGKQLDNNNPLDNAYAGLYLLNQNYNKFKQGAPSERGAWMRAVAAYHAGAGNVQKDLQAGGMGIPDVGDGLINTRDHVYNIFNGTKAEDFGGDVEQQPSVSPQTTGLVPGAGAMRQVQARQQTPRAPGPTPQDLNAQLLSALKKSQPRTRPQPSLDVGGKVGAPAPNQLAQTLANLPEPVRWAGEVAARGTGDIATNVAGWDILSPAVAALNIGGEHAGISPRAGYQQAGKYLKEAASQSGANRGAVSQYAQGVGSGLISNAPAMGLTALGIPPQLAFAMQGAAQARGEDKSFKDILLEATKGAALGQLYELAPAAKASLLNRIATRLFAVGGGTAGVEIAANSPYGLSPVTIANAIKGDPKARDVLLKAAQSGASMGALGAAGELLHTPSPREPQLAEAVPASQPREFAPTLAPSELAQRTALREQGTVPAATLPEALPERRLNTIPLGPRRGPTPRAGEAPVVPDQNLSEQPGVGIGPQSGDIMTANAKIDSINRRLNEVAQIKNPTGRAQRLQADLQSQLADATATRNALLDPKVQAQMEGRPLADVLAERRQNEGRMDTTEAGVPEESPIEVPASDTSHYSTRQNRRVRNVASGNAGQFKPGFKDEGAAISGSVTDSNVGGVLAGEPQLSPYEAEVKARAEHLAKQRAARQGTFAATEAGAAQPAVATETTAIPPETTGIAHRVETAARGSEPVRGESIGAEESVQRGRDLLTQSDDPGRLVAKTVTAFDRTGAVSPESMAIVRAQHEQLAQKANRAFDAGGLNSPEFKTAEKARQEFYNNTIKPMQTAWSNTGRAQQGETAIDTGTFYGLYRAFKDTNGREMTPREQASAQKLSQGSAAADHAVVKTQQRLVDTLNSLCPPG
jgi:hypothetical protein